MGEERRTVGIGTLPIEPTLEATTAAAENAKINDDLTFFLGWADGDKAYPIAAQTWMLAYTKYSDAQRAINVNAINAAFPVAPQM